jgi:hypothetical protein
MACRCFGVMLAARRIVTREQAGGGDDDLARQDGFPGRILDSAMAVLLMQPPQR